MKGERVKKQKKAKADPFLQKKWAVPVLCIIGGLLLYAAASAGGAMEDEAAEGYLNRGGYGEDEKLYELFVEGAGEETLVCQVEVRPRQYTEEEARLAFARIFDGLEEEIRGENPGLDHVETDLTLPETFSEPGITASWYSDAPDILDSYGQIQIADCPAEGVQAWLSVELSDGNYQESRTFPVYIFPETVPEGQRLARAIETEIRRAEEKDLHEALVKLPDSYDGHPLRYHQAGEDYRLIPVLGIVAAVLLYARSRNQGEEERKKRRKQLELDYADVVYRLMVFVGAGLTVGRAWERIVQDYEARRNENRCGLRYAYEEMADAQAKMQYGIPEGQAIEEFGKRCQLQSYLKLSSLLEQNRRTGTKNLTKLLEQEMNSAWEQQKSTARRLGEEAGTKLLLPLMLMLIVVMVIIMVPAMMTV